MRTLFLDLASHHGSVACVTEERVVALAEVDHRVDDRAFMELMERVLREAGWTYADLTGIACVVGPGGFTSLRVAVAAANALGNAVEVPVTGIHLSEIYIARVAPSPRPSPAGRGRSFWLHSTRKKELFVREVGVDAEPRLITIDQLGEAVPEGSAWMGELIEAQRGEADRLKLQPAPLVSLADVLPSFLSKQAYGHEIVKPWYGRGW